MSIVPENQNQENSRNIAVYKYLLKLTDLTASKSSQSNGRPTAEQSKYPVSSIANQWGTDRMFVQRIVENIYPEQYPNSNKKNSKLPGLTLNKVVQILVELKDRSPKGKITRKNIIKALRLFTQLSPDDERRLDIKYHNTLLQELKDSIHKLPEDIIPEVTAKVYDNFLTIKQYSNRNLISSKNTKDTIKFYVKKHMENMEISATRDVENRDLFDTLCRKSLRRIKRVEMQNGSEIFDYLLINEKPINHSRVAIDTLTKCVVENHVLTEKFPIHIKYIEVRKNPALPLYLDGTTSVLNEEFHNNSESWINSIGNDTTASLKHLVSFTVKVHFYIDIPLDKISSIPDPSMSKISNLDIDINKIPNSDGKDRFIVDFFEEITGTGSPISQAITAINRVLFWDIPSLQDYFPTPKNFIVRHEVLGTSPNAMIHGHNVIGLFKKSDLRLDPDNSPKYIEQYSQESATGDYCGSDILEVTAKSVLYARLRAIKQIGIDSNEYINQVLNRIQEINALRKAKNLLDYFPFSSLAMQDYIENSIFSNNSGHRIFGENINYIKTSAENWSMVAHEAYLEIAEAFLKEGLYVLGKTYLDPMKYLDRDEYSNKIDFLVRAKYYLCMFRYYYLNGNHKNLPSMGIEEAAKNANKMLDKANECLEEYIKEYHLIDEKQCAIFYDFFHVLSRVNAHRAKLNLFLEGRTPEDKLKRAMRLFENARIFAARDGNPSLYSIWTAYQSWCYVMNAYLKPPEEKDKYLNWAEKLLSHANICYSEKGKKCYEDIKANAGQDYSNDSKSICIDEVPFIVEVDKRESIGLNERDKLTINMSVFRQDNSTYSSKSRGYKKIYLFGTQSCLLLFSMGILKLCRNYDSEQEIKVAIEDSKELFNYSWSIAEEGFKKKDAVDKNEFKRQFHIRELSTEQGKKISLLIPEFSVCGLYPHRLTQFADFGKIFSIACLLINLSIVLPPDTTLKLRGKTIEEEKELIEYLIGRLTENNCYFNSEETQKEQERYNNHLRSIYNQIKRYADDLIKGKTTYSSTEEARDRIIGDFFRMILTRPPVE